MAAILEHLDRIEVLARRDVAQRERLADHRRLLRAERMNVLDALDAQAALEQRGGDGGRRHGLELVAGGGAEFGHVLLAALPSPLRGGATGRGRGRLR